MAACISCTLGYYCLQKRLRKGSIWRGYVPNPRCDVFKFEKVVSGFLEVHWDTSLYTLKFHFVDHLVIDLNLFGGPYLLGLCEIDWFNAKFRNVFQEMSK